MRVCFYLTLLRGADVRKKAISPDSESDFNTILMYILLLQLKHFPTVGSTKYFLFTVRVWCMSEVKRGVVASLPL